MIVFRTIVSKEIIYLSTGVLHKKNINLSTVTVHDRLPEQLEIESQENIRMIESLGRPALFEDPRAMVPSASEPNLPLSLLT